MPVRFQQDHQESGEMVSLTDDSKAATTDAQKKCATMLGIGLHLYNGDNSVEYIGKAVFVDTFISL